MLNNTPNNRSKNRRRKWFILLPAVFLLCGYLLLSACLTPFLDPLISVYKLAFTNTNVHTIDEAGVSSVFNGSTGLKHGKLNSEDIEFPKYGEVFAHLSIEGTDIDTPIIYGENKQLLRKAACMSLYSHIPGCGKGTMISAHNNRAFRSLKDVKEGAIVHLETTYGEYVYRVYKTQIINKSDEAAYSGALNGDKDELLLYTCYASRAIGSTPYRFFTFCEFVSGPSVNLYEEE